MTEAIADPGLVWTDDVIRRHATALYVLGNLVQAEIVAAIRALPSRHRLMVYLADVKGLGYRQIVDLTGIPVGTVKSSLHRGRGQLRARQALSCSGLGGQDP